MALSDIYYQQPWNTQAQGQQQMQQGLGQLAQMPMQQAQLQAQQQANTDAAYNSPARSANPYEQQLSGDVLDMLPGLPEHKAQLRAELAGQGQGLQGPATGPVQGPQAPAPVQNLGPMGMGQPAIGMGGYAGPQQQRPFGPPPTPAPQANAPQRVQAGTRGDVDLTMRMAPFLKANHDDPRIAINNANLAYKREALAQRQRLAEMADQTRRELARLMAAYKQNPDDKVLIEEIRQAAANHRAAMGDKARMDSGIGGIVDEPGAQEQKRAEDRADLEAQKEYHDLIDQAKSRKPGVSRSGSAGGPVGAAGAGRLKVTIKATGEPGTILQSEWDPNIYSKRP